MDVCSKFNTVKWVPCSDQKCRGRCSKEAFDPYNINIDLLRIAIETDLVSLLNEFPSSRPIWFLIYLWCMTNKTAQPKRHERCLWSGLPKHCMLLLCIESRAADMQLDATRGGNLYVDWTAARCGITYKQTQCNARYFLVCSVTFNRAMRISSWRRLQTVLYVVSGCNCTTAVRTQFDLIPVPMQRDESTRLRRSASRPVRQTVGWSINKMSGE